MTVAAGELPGKAVKTLDGGYYSGSELYYAWAIPTGVLVSSDFGKRMRKPGTLSTLENYSVLSDDRGYWSGDSLHLKMIGGGAVPVSADGWIVVPFFGAPLWVSANTAGHTAVSVAPGAQDRRAHV